MNGLTSHLESNSILKFSFLYIYTYISQASLVSQMVKSLWSMQETQFQSLGQEDTLEKRMAAHSSILAWRIPWSEKLGRLQSMGCKESDTSEQLTLAYIYKEIEKTLLERHMCCSEIKDLGDRWNYPKLPN